MLVRRGAGTIALIALATGCAPSNAATTAKAPGPPLHMSPVADLAPAAGLSWIVIAHPRELASHAELIPALHVLASEEAANAFATRNGGVSPFALDDLAIAGYAQTTLYLARGMLDPRRVEASFTARTEPRGDSGRALDRDDPAEPIVRLWGTLHGERQQLAIFGRHGAGLEIGRFGPLRATEMFAEGRLKRAHPALRAGPLEQAASRLGDAPLRAFALGPFEGETARLLGGLLGASTAAALSVRLAPPGANPSGLAALECTLVLLGAWNDDAPAAAERLRSAFHAFAESPPGRLASLHRPLGDPRTSADADAIALTATFDALALARGIRASTDAEVAEIMAY